MTREAQNKALQIKIRKLAPDAIETMGELLRDQNTPAPTKAQLIGFVLERTLGKPDATIHLTTSSGTRHEAENRLIALVQEIREETTLTPENNTEGTHIPEDEEDADEEAEQEDDDEDDGTDEEDIPEDY